MNPIRHLPRTLTIALLGALPAALLAPVAPVAAQDGPAAESAPVTETAPAGAPAPIGERRTIDLAICLDTSGSMNGLIDSARRKIWAIVNDLALAKPVPRLRVALLTYGNNGHPEAEGWVRVDADLTEDLDLISEKLFALTTNGGTELVGRVLDRARTALSWHEGSDTLRLIVVAGNESADQDQQVRYPDVCKRLIARGIMVDSLYCGNPADDIAPGWKQVALLADGHYAAIDQQQGTVTVSTPFDDRLTELSTALNGTYVPFGASGREGQERQSEADARALQEGKAVAASRANAKQSALYCNSWCLVDAVTNHLVKLEELDRSQLPEELREMTIDELRAYLEAKLEKRKEIQQQIAQLNAKRQEYVAQELAKAGSEQDRAFDAAVRGAIRSQAATKGFRFAEEPAAAGAQPAAESPPAGE